MAVKSNNIFDIAYENPVSAFPDPIEGDFRFHKTGKDLIGDIERALLLLESLPQKYEVGLVRVGRIDDDRRPLPSMTIKRAFYLASNEGKPNVAAADVEFSDYHLTIPEMRLKFDHPETVDGYLANPRFQLMCALLGFSKVESANGKYIEPKIEPVPVLSR